jgi:RNA polymerase sigma-70 factor, ECF subfamily
MDKEGRPEACGERDMAVDYSRELSKLLSAHGPALQLYARQWVGSMAEAEDAVCDGILRFWRSGKKATPNPLPLLYTMVRRAAIDRARSRFRREARERTAGEELYANQPVFECSMEQEERRKEIESALANLPAEQKEIVVMKIWGDLTFQEIADSLGISINTAASRYRYAMERLKVELKEL